MGKFYHNLDEKSRLVIPTIYRKELGEEFIIAQGLEKCLYVYSLKEWDNLVSKLNELPFNKKDARTFTRTFFSGASVCKFDNNGRINITSPLVNYAGLTKNCVIIGVNNRLEVWSEEIFEAFCNANLKSIEKIAEDLFDGITL